MTTGSDFSAGIEGGNISEERARRFYDRLRSGLDARVKRLGKMGEFVLLVPDVFILLWRLANDPRVASSHKVLLGSGLAYYLFPLDVIPDFLGIGFIDDLIFGVYIINRLLQDVDDSIVREHWSGEGDVLDMVKRVLGMADPFLSKRFGKK